MAAAPPLLPPLPDARRPSAVRRFPLGCGRHLHTAAQQTRRADYIATRDALPNPSAEMEITHRTEGSDRGVGDGPVDEPVLPVATASTVRRVSAVRRFPPGCGRAVAVRPVPKLEATAVEGEVEAKAGEILQAARNGGQKSKDVPCRGDPGSNGGAEGDNGGVRPWIGTGIMPAPLMPWARRGRRSQQRPKQF